MVIAAADLDDFVVCAKRYVYCGLVKKSHLKRCPQRANYTRNHYI